MMQFDNLDHFTRAATEGLSPQAALELIAIVRLAAQFCDANDRGDDAGRRLETEDLTDAEEEALMAAGDQSDEDYNRVKAELFGAVRALMGWPARPPHEPIEPGPHPFAQEGTW